MKILGLVDTHHICDCCGKPDLGRTVAIELDNSEIVHYGTTCATRKHGISVAIKTLNVIRAEVRAARNMQEFAQSMTNRGFGDTKVLSPMTDAVDQVTWTWGDVVVTHRDIIAS